MPTQEPSHFKRLLVCLLAVTSLMTGLGIAPRLGAQEVVEQLELDRRRALLEEAAVLMHKGEQSMAQRSFDHAMEAFAGVREMLPRAPMTAEMLQNATSRYVDAAMAQSEAQLEAGDLQGAKVLVERVLTDEVAPGHPAATAMLERLNDPVRNNPAMNLRHADQVQQVVDLLIKAEGAIALGRYDLANGQFQEVLRIDPFNVTARRGMEQVTKLKDPKAVFDHTRAELLMEVDREWELPMMDIEKLVVPDGREPSVKDLKMIQVEEKLKRIMIPHIAMEQITLAEAIDFLRETTVREDNLTLDQQARGVNFLISLGSAESEESKQIMEKRFNLRLTNVPVAQVLKYITEQTGTTYRVDDYSVMILKVGAVDEMIARTYRVPPDFVGGLSGNAQAQPEKDPFGDSDAQPGLLAVRLGLKELLVKKGVSFPEGSSASYSPGSGLLQVVNTSQNQDMVSQLIDLVKDAEPVAVAVEVKILKVQQSNLKELGFDWLLTAIDLGQGFHAGGGTNGSGPGRVAGDFAPTISMPSDPTAAVNGVITSGLRSGSQVYNSSTIDGLIANPNRNNNQIRSAPGIFSLSGIFSDGEGQMIMRGMDQKKGVDVMATSSLVTRSGESSKVVLVREFIYPTEYDPPELPSGNIRASLVTPANPSAFEMKEVGVLLEVLPVVTDNQKRYIDITLMPEIVDFDGFVNFGSPISAIVSNLLGGQERVQLTENQILMPIFSTKRATTQLTIADGATIVYAGLHTESIVTADDQVPILGDLPIVGRLFQTTAQIPDKTVIVFMVHVELMDPTGRPYREVGSR